LGRVISVLAGLLIRESGHVPKDCTKNRVFDMSNIADATVEVAWDNLLKADEEKDLDEIRAVSGLLNTSQLFHLCGYRRLRYTPKRFRPQPTRSLSRVFVSIT